MRKLRLRPATCLAESGMGPWLLPPSQKRWACGRGWGCHCPKWYSGKGYDATGRDPSYHLRISQLFPRPTEWCRTGETLWPEHLTGAQRPTSKGSHPRASHLASLSLSFLIYKTRNGTRLAVCDILESDPGFCPDESYFKPQPKNRKGRTMSQTRGLAGLAAYQPPSIH